MCVGHAVISHADDFMVGQKGVGTFCFLMDLRLIYLVDCDFELQRCVLHDS
jgi:hypothetical protein